MSRVENLKMKKGKLQVSGADAVLRMFKVRKMRLPIQEQKCLWAKQKISGFVLRGCC